MISDCCSPCDTQVPPLSIPGPAGADGAPGAAGTDGVDAFTTTTADFTSPADTTTAFTISVASSLMFVVGMDLIVGQGPGAALANPGPCAVVITAIPSPNAITVKNLRAVDESVTVSSGALVAASGFLAATPVTIAQGGTNAITKAAAQTSLGLGQNSIVSSGAALAQAITAANVQVGAVDVQIPALGSYELRAQVGIDFNGVTFAASRTITVKIRNITQAVDIVSGVLHTQTVTTLSFPTHFLQLPPIRYDTAAVNDHLQLLVMIDVINSAGTLSVDSGSLEAVPLRLT
jgi:hypothetical protein